MGKRLFIAEKPSVAQEFAKALKENLSRRDGYLESAESIVTWCVGHLITMSYPEVYDERLKRWSLDTIPFLPKEWKYEVIDSVKKQFGIVSELLNRPDVETIYVCTDSGREGEYIYRLVDRMAGVPDTKDRRRVWIDSQTEEEILRGIREAKPLSEYDNLSSAAYLRAKEDYLMGINFSRALSLKYGNMVKNALHADKYAAISVGRVMTCVLGMVVNREREIRSFTKTPFYRITGNFQLENAGFSGEWKAVKDSRYFESPLLYRENGFKRRADALKLCGEILGGNAESFAVTPEPNPDGSVPEPSVFRRDGISAVIDSLEKKKEKKNPPLLFNLAELQNECSKAFKISPDETLKIVQELYEKKLVTYPRTDARVLSTAVSKEIGKNLKGISAQAEYYSYCKDIMELGSYKTIGKTKYTDDKQITDHYAIIPTGQGLSELGSLSSLSKQVYDRIVRRFLAVFYPPAEYRKVSVVMKKDTERFFANFRVLENPGFQKVYSFASGETKKNSRKKEENAEDESQETKEVVLDEGMFEKIMALKPGSTLPLSELSVKEGTTNPPKRYNSGSLILAMENAGKLIEDEELREQIKGSGIGTSATRAEILNKLVKIEYLKLDKKTQIITPRKKGEMVYEIVLSSMRSLLNAELTASWEKGLTGVAGGTISEEEYMQKLEAFVTQKTNGVKTADAEGYLRRAFAELERYY